MYTHTNKHKLLNLWASETSEKKNNLQQSVYLHWWLASLP